MEQLLYNNVVVTVSRNTRWAAETPVLIISDLTGSVNVHSTYGDFREFHRTGPLVIQHKNSETNSNERKSENCRFNFRNVTTTTTTTLFTLFKFYINLRVKKGRRPIYPRYVALLRSEKMKSTRTGEKKKTHRNSERKNYWKINSWQVIFGTPSSGSFSSAVWSLIFFSQSRARSPTR